MNARDGFRSGIEMMQQSARLMSVFTPGRGLFCDWQELDNKIEAFRLFQYSDRELALPVDRLPIDEVVRRALTQDAFRAIWLLEGVGHIKGTAHSIAARGLLSEGPAELLPDRALIPLHAGMGTAFAEKIFAGLDSNSSAPAVRLAVSNFVEACRANCRKGWADACMEPLGLVVRCLYPSLLTAVSEAMEETHPALRTLFWHGVGRSLYFVPTNFLPIPGARDRMLRSAVSEATRGVDRRNVLAGLIWAVTLVNLRQPEIVREVVPICLGLNKHDEFTNGLISALLGWRHMAPEDVRYLSAYTSPVPARASDASLWKTWVELPARNALENIYPGLERHNKIPSLYTWRTSEELSALGAPEANILND